MSQEHYRANHTVNMTLGLGKLECHSSMVNIGCTYIHGYICKPFLLCHNSSETAIIVLDDLARLVECVAVAQQLHVTHHLLHTLSTLLTSTPPHGTKLLVIGTITLSDDMSLEESLALGFPELFTKHEFVSLMDTEDIRTFISARNIRRFGVPEGVSVSLRTYNHDDNVE